MQSSDQYSADDERDRARLVSLYSAVALNKTDHEIDEILRKRPTAAERAQMWATLERKYRVFFTADTGPLQHRHRVFVYGSLMQHLSNHDEIQSPEHATVFEGVGRTVWDDLTMVSAGEFPMVLCQEDSRPGSEASAIQGEVYEVDSKTLWRVDELEGHPDWYSRELTMIQLADGQHLEAWLYLMKCQDDIQAIHNNTVRFADVSPLGNWRQFLAATATRQAATCRPAPYTWNSTEQRWQEDCSSAHSGQGIEATRQMLRCVSYNVWFDQHQFHKRCMALFDILRHSDAHCICLQEVLPDFIEILVQQEWVRQRFCVSDTTGSTLGAYGVLMLIDRSVMPSQFTLHPLESAMGRSLLTCRVRVAGEDCTIATIHLESLDNARCRANQLAAIWQILDRVSANGHAVLMGDFNFSDGPRFQIEQQALDAKYIDVWKQINPQVAGHTMRASGPYPAWRPDQALVRSNRFVPIAADLIGIDSIGECNECDAKGFQCLPSDHYGLRFEFGLK